MKKAGNNTLSDFRATAHPWDSVKYVSDIKNRPLGEQKKIGSKVKSFICQ